MTYPASPQIVVGTRTLMIAQRRLRQDTISQRLADVQPGQPFYARTDRAAGLVEANLAAYAPTGTPPPPPPEPPWTVSGTVGAAFGTSNASH
jgi:hypothetical protein